MKNKYSLGLIITALWSCANPVTPSGGNKDVNPPKILFINPASKSTGIHPKHIVFTFDENIQVSNAKEQIIVSPAPKEKHIITAGKNTIKLDLPEKALDDNTTYSIQLNESIKDLNEGNPGKYDPYLFATGNSLDTLNIYGNCSFIENVKTQKVKIKTVSSNPRKTIADKSLLFSLPGMPLDSAWIIAYNDLNGNDEHNKGEEIGLCKTYPGDTVHVRLYKTAIQKIGLIRYSNKRYGCYGEGIYKENKNSLLQYKDTLIGDSSTLFSFLKTLDTSSYSFAKKAENKKEVLLYYWNKPAYLNDSIQEIHFISNRVLVSPEGKNIIFINTKDVKENAHITKTEKNRITIVFKNNQTGRIKIPYHFITEDNENITDTLKSSIPVYTSLQIANKENFEICLSIMHKNTGERKNIKLQPKEKMLFWVLSGEHEIHYYHDKNNNNKLDGPNIEKRETGEYYRNLPVLKIKENMGVDLDIIPLEKP